MKHLLRSLTILVLAAGSWPVFAQGPPIEGIDRDGDGVLSPAEFAVLADFEDLRNPALAFAFLDVDEDGAVSQDELERGWSDVVFRFGFAYESAGPPLDGPPATVGGDVDDGVRASRLFAGPRDYPPKDFAAYGIVAFRFAATDANRTRYLAICEGFLAAIPAAADLEAQGVPLSEQMVTVWPVRTRPMAEDLNDDSPARSSRTCETAVDGIDLATSLSAISAAKRAQRSADFGGDGPYLLAWSPASTKGKRDALVLVFDLSDVTTVAEATRRFGDWAVEIENDPELWRGGWNIENLRITLRQLADKYGDAILQLIGSIGGG
jgi:hypothetical protein